MTKELRKRMESNLPLFDEIIDDMIATGDRDERAIERILDTLLDYGYMGMGEKQFNRLVEYYGTFSPKYAEEYRGFYQELSE